MPTEPARFSSLWSYHGIRLETPAGITKDDWEMLKKYLDVVEPEFAEVKSEPQATVSKRKRSRTRRPRK